MSRVISSRLVHHATALAALVLLAACGGDSGTGQPSVDRVDVTGPSAALEQGGTLQLTATAKDNSGRNVSAGAVAWSSNAPGVAEVSASGLVTGRGTGSAQISAAVAGKTGVMQVTVGAPGVSSVRITPAPATVAVLKTANLSAEALTAGGGVIPGRLAQWSSSDTTIVSVNVGGIISGRRLGTATITAEIDGKQGSAQVTVTASSLNLTVAGMYINQAVQTPTGNIPLVANRDGYLRVFALANETGAVAPPVRVRVYQSGVLAATLTVPAAVTHVPTAVSDGEWDGSWNVRIPGNLIRPGLSILADVNPVGAGSEANPNDNVFPASGQPQPMDVRNIAPLRIVMVPVLQTTTGLTGNLTAANMPEYLDFIKRVFPIPAVDATLRAPYSSNSAALDPGNDNGSWSTVLSEMNALRVAEGSTANYFGVVKWPFTGGGTAGLGYIGGLAAIGYDGGGRGPITAHEVGHNMGRLHAPCGSAGGTDPQYPYAGATIGVTGVDVMGGGEVKNSQLHDIMSYCYEWISDYTYRAVMNFRGFQGAAVPSGAEQSALLVWGRTGPNGVELEPAFQIETRPALPPRPGPYTLEGVDAAGQRVFSVSFAPEQVGDGKPGEAAFAFALPVTAEQAGRVATLRVSGAGRRAERSAVGGAAGARLNRSVDAAQRSGARMNRVRADRVEFQWDAAQYPMAMVRDPANGQILSFARGGKAALATRRGELEVVFSNGVQSRTQRLEVQP